MKPQTSGAMLDALEARTRGYASQYHGLPPARMLPLVDGHLGHLLRRLDHEPTHRRLQLIAGETAMLAGYLSFRRANRGDARRRYGLAEQLARAAGEGPLLAFALVGRSTLRSSLPLGGHGGDSRWAISVLDEAVRSVGPQTDPRLRAWLHSHRAREYAAIRLAAGIGADALAGRELDEGERALAQAGPPESGFHYQQMRDMTEYRAACAVLLGYPEHAEGILGAKLQQLEPGDLSNRGSLLVTMAAASARQKEIERACVLLSEALDIARRLGLASRIQRIEGTRLKYLAAWPDEPAVRALDERLAQAL